MDEPVIYTDLVEDYISQFAENASIKDVVYTIVKDNLIDKKALRNKAIIKDFDGLLKKNNKSMRTIYDDLCFKYNLSLRMIQEIITHR